MRTITLEITNHPWRCIDEAGGRCPHLRVSHFGQRWHCGVFSERETLEERDGCLVRHPECLRAETTQVRG